MNLIEMVQRYEAYRNRINRGRRACKNCIISVKYCANCHAQYTNRQ